MLPDPFLNRIKKFYRINRLYHRYIRKYHLQFVLLEMADKMPADVAGKLHGLSREFLRTALPEDTLPGIVGFPERFDRVEFGNCHQFYS